ncbi:MULTISPECIES: hypothetical protein [Spirulina sp. CCY15215]|nr:hypothetical protein [Spirulina major]
MVSKPPFSKPLQTPFLQTPPNPQYRKNIKNAIAVKRMLFCGDRTTII